jgi:hypothetical protein
MTEQTNESEVPPKPDPNDPWEKQIQALADRQEYLIQKLVPEQDDEEENALIQAIETIQDTLGRLEPMVQGISNRLPALNAKSGGRS